MQLYKASKSNRGCACSMSFNSKEGSLFIQLIKQVSYNEERHIGSFAGGEKIVIKSTIFEIGSFLDVLRRNVEYSTVHKSKDATTQIWFAPYFVGEGDQKTQRGYGLRVTKKTTDNKEVKFLMPFNFGEAEVLKSYLDFVLRHIFSAEYAEEKKRFKERQSKKSEQQSTTENSSVSQEITADEEL